MMQLASLGVTMAIAVVGGLVTGYLIHIEWIFNPLKDHELFEDELFFDGVGYEDDIEGLRTDPLCIGGLPPFCDGGIRMAQFISIFLFSSGLIGIFFLRLRTYSGKNKKNG